MYTMLTEVQTAPQQKSASSTAAPGYTTLAPGYTSAGVFNPLVYPSTRVPRRRSRYPSSWVEEVAPGHSSSTPASSTLAPGYTRQGTRPGQKNLCTLASSTAAPGQRRPGSRCGAAPVAGPVRIPPQFESFYTTCQSVQNRLRKHFIQRLKVRRMASLFCKNLSESKFRNFKKCKKYVCIIKRVQY